MSTALTTSDRFYVRAAIWALTHGASPELERQFALAYQEAIDEIPVDRYPDDPLPTPAEFADANPFEYGRLIDTTPIGTVIPCGDLWIARCTTCGWDRTELDATTYDEAVRTASIHNSEIHPRTRRPEWADVAAWAAGQRKDISA